MNQPPAVQNLPGFLAKPPGHTLSTTGKPAWQLTAAELTAAYRCGELSPVQATAEVLAHVALCEPALQATCAWQPEAALAMARQSEARWQRHQPLSVLDGVPVTIKDNLPVRGWPTRNGTAASSDAPALEDCPPAARLRESGAVLLGQTTMPDYGMLSSALSSLHPLTRNPWDLDKTPGGSSAGAGAAAAAGYGPLHIGTDIGGSIRLPAGWCSVVGFKPSGGRVPITAPFSGRVAGPLARTVADVAMAMAVLSQPDWRDATSLPAQPLGWSDLDIDPGKNPDANPDLRGCKLGLLMDAGWGLDVEPDTRAAIENAARLLASAGATVQPIAPISSRAMVQGMDQFWRLRFWLELQALAPERRQRVLPYIRDWAASAQALTASQAYQGQAQVAALRDAAVVACQPFDYVLSPVSPVPAFTAEWASPLNDPARPFEHIAFTLPFNMSEQPAISLPCGFTRGARPLPIGLQIAGRRHDDLGVLRLARVWEQLRPVLPAWPPLA